MGKTKRLAVTCIHCNKRTTVSGRVMRQVCEHCGMATPKRRAKPSEITLLIDALFSLYVRRRDAEGRQKVCYCCTCGKRKHWQEMDAGHFVVREKRATRWHYKNSHCQCQNCNHYGRGEQAKHAMYIDRRYGAGTAEFLIALGDKGEAPTDSEKIHVAGNLLHECIKLGVEENARDLRSRYPAAWVELLGDG